MGSVGSITITTVEVVANATAWETSSATPRPGTRVILLSGRGIVKDRGIGPRRFWGPAPPIWKKWPLRAHRIPGSARWKVAPWSGFAVAQSRPRWLSMIERLIESPMPRPPGFVV